MIWSFWSTDHAHYPRITIYLPSDQPQGIMNPFHGHSYRKSSISHSYHFPQSLPPFFKTTTLRAHTYLNTEAHYWFYWSDLTKHLIHSLKFLTSSALSVVFMSNCGGDRREKTVPHHRTRGRTIMDDWNVGTMYRPVLERSYHTMPSSLLFTIIMLWQLRIIWTSVISLVSS